nr:reverse transcriptase domain-containing protein [Tanacetum cinerariifolium]
MQTRSSSRLVSNPSSNPTPSTNPNPKCRNRRRSKQRIKEFNLEELSPPIVTMTDQRTMAQLLQAPTEGYEDAIVRFDESFSEARDRFKDIIRACPHHGFLKLHQLDTFHNALNSKDQDSLNSAAGGNFLDKMPRECLAIIESKSKVRYSCKNPVVAKVSMNTSTFGISPDVAELKDMVKALLLDKKSQNQAPATLKAVEESCVTYGGAHSYRNFLAIDGNIYRDNIQEFVSQVFAVNYNQGNTNYPITTQSGVSYDGPQIPPPPSFLPKVVEKDMVTPPNNGSTEDVQPPVVQTETLKIQISKPVSEPVIALVSAPKPNPKASIPYPSRRNDERNREKANNQIEKFYQIFKDMTFEISFADALILMPKFVSTLKALIRNKEKLSEMARTPLNEHCLVLLLKKFPEKLGDPGKLSLPELTPTYFDADPRVPLILKRSILKTGRALIDVFKGELTLRVGKEAITFNLDQTLRYSANYNDNLINQIDVIEMVCEEYSQEVLGFSNVVASGNPTPYYDPIVSTTSSTLTPFRNSDFLLEEVDAFLALEDDLTSPEVDQSYLDPEGDILLLEAFLNDDPSLPPQNQGNYLPEVCKELKICEAKSDKSSIDEPPEVELKDLPPHLEYAFLEGDDKLPVIIVKDLSVEEKTALITVLKSHKRAIAWKLSDINGIEPEFCTHKIIKEEDFEPARCMMAIFHDMIDKTMEVFMNDFSVFGNSFQSCLSHLEKMLKRCEDTNLCLNWEKSHLMVKEGHTGFYRRFIKDFSKIARPMTRLLEKDTAFIFSKECVEAFQTLKRKLTEAPILIAPDWDMPFKLMCDASDFAIGAVLRQRQDKHFRPIHYANSKARLLRWVLLLQEFTFKVIDTKGAENLATNHLSRLENSHQNVLDPKEINESFPLETLDLVSTRGDHRKVQLNELNELHDQAYENSLIYKEKTKRLHNSKIKDNVFNIGERVLLFNSRLKIFSGKLKSRWSGPFTISHVYPYDTVELSQPDRPNFKVNGHCLKHYFGEDVPKLVVPDLQTFPEDH